MTAIAATWQRFRWPVLPLGFAVVGIGLAFAAGQAMGTLPQGGDLWCYWQATPGPGLYPASWVGSGGNCYPYAPPLAQAMTLLHGLGWPLVQFAWTAGLFACLAFVARGWGLLAIAVGLLATVGVLPYLAGTAVLGDLLGGNVMIVLAAVSVAGFRYPALWAFPLLTKASPGVGVLWFAFRREWRSFGIALGATLAVVAISFALSPSSWLAWPGFLVRISGEDFPGPHLAIPLLLRLPFAVALLWWGARGNRRWTVPLAVALSLPMLYVSTVAVLLGAIPFCRTRPSSGG